MFVALGFDSAADMIRDGYKLDPAEIDMAVDWLKLRKPNEPVALDQAIEMGKHGGAREGAGRPKAGEAKEPKAENQVAISHLKTSAFSSTSRVRILARLDRDGHAAPSRGRPRQLRQDAAGELSRLTGT